MSGMTGRSLSASGSRTQSWSAVSRADLEAQPPFARPRKKKCGACCVISIVFGVIAILAGILLLLWSLDIFESETDRGVDDSGDQSESPGSANQPFTGPKAGFYKDVFSGVIKRVDACSESNSGQKAAVKKSLGLLFAELEFQDKKCGGFGTLDAQFRFMGEDPDLKGKTPKHSYGLGSGCKNGVKDQWEHLGCDFDKKRFPLGRITAFRVRAGGKSLDWEYRASNSVEIKTAHSFANLDKNGKICRWDTEIWTLVE